MRYVRFLLAMLIASVLAPEAAWAFDKTGHYTLVYAAARRAGYTIEDAALVADASQSLDDNWATTAFEFGKIGQEGQQLAQAGAFASPSRLGAGIADLDHLRTGQLFHALASPENRARVEQMHLDRLQRLRTDARYSDPDRRRLEMIFLGEYLHFVADMVVHPHDPLFGHAGQLHAPDRPEDHMLKMQAMLHVVRDHLQRFRDHRDNRNDTGLLRTTAEQLRGPAPAAVDVQLQQVANSVVRSWRPSFRQFAGNAGERLGKNDWVALADFTALCDKEKEENIAQQVGHVLGEMVPSHRTIHLDANGDPLPTPHNQARFGKLTVQRRIEDLPFYSLTNASELARERQQAVDRAGQLAFQTVQNAAAWMLPAGPGGVALNPELEMPAALGAAEKIKLTEKGLAVVSSTGEFALPIHPHRFATILRTVAGGEIPFVTIGSEPSDKVGYAKVTYAPSLRGTREGAMLYRADVQFKALFANFPFGEKFSLNVPGDNLVGGMPPHGGESVRFWITCSGVKLKIADGKLQVERHGMRINSETKLLREVARDPAMDAYTNKLTERWDLIADKVWEFRAIEELALATSLAFWVRQNRVSVEPVIWTLPPRYDHTPDYVPILASVGKTTRVTGGVTLTPEERGRRAGRQFFFRIAAFIDRSEQISGDANQTRWTLGGGTAASMLFILLFPGFLIWLAGKWTLRGSGSRLPFFGVLWFWIKVLLLQTVLCVALCTLVFGDWLTRFDREFLGWLATLVGGPALFFFLLYRGGPKLGNLASNLGRSPTGAAALVVAALSVPLWTSGLASSTATMTVLACGVVPSPALERALTWELAPADILTEATTSVEMHPNKPGKISVLPVPHSIRQAWAPRFQLVTNSGKEKPGETFVPVVKDDVTFPIDTLQRVRWPAGMPINPGMTHYTIDGEPPY